MNKRFVKAAIVASLLSTAAVFAVTAPLTPAYAKASGPSVSGPVAKLLQQAQKSMEANDFAGALALIKQAQALPDQTPFDTYKINEFLGNDAVRLNDHATADTAFEAMAESPSLNDVTPEEKAQTLRLAALLANEQKHYVPAIKYAKAFIALGGPADPLVLTSLSEAYYYTEDYTDAEAISSQMIAATPAGQTPDRGGLEVLFGSQLKQKKQDAALKTLEVILNYYNDADEWGQLLDVSLGVKGIKDVEALQIYRLRFAAKATSHPDDYTTAAGVALGAGLPVEAETILKAGGVTSGKTYADAHTRANTDRATIAQFDAEARKSPNGQLDLRLAETYYGYARYADAAEAARRALQKGGAKADPNEANMVLGESLLAQGNTAGAIAAFNAISNPSPGLAKAQHLWLLYAQAKYNTAAPAAAGH
jgi:hypothetical protein